jgi:DNA-binding NarL/FixJ family response regulator
MAGEQRKQPLRLSLHLSDFTRQRLEELRQEKGKSGIDEIVVEAIETFVKLRSKSSSFERLTSRQREVLQLIARGYKTREIARKLFLSVKTVEMHRAQMMQALDLHNIVEVVRFAVRMGIIDP